MYPVKQISIGGHCPTKRNPCCSSQLSWKLSMRIRMIEFRGSLWYPEDHDWNLIQLSAKRLCRLRRLRWRPYLYVRVHSNIWRATTSCRASCVNDSRKDLPGVTCDVHGFEPISSSTWYQQSYLLPNAHSGLEPDGQLISRRVGAPTGMVLTVRFSWLKDTRSLVQSYYRKKA
jgi:hypothetical protein